MITNPRKNGTNATDIRPSAAVSAAKARSRKIRRRSSGSGARSSQATNAAISANPTTMQPHVAMLPQPHRPDCWNPSTIRPIAPVTRTVPR